MSLEVIENFLEKEVADCLQIHFQNFIIYSQAESRRRIRSASDVSDDNEQHLRLGKLGVRVEPPQGCPIVLRSSPSA